MERVLNQSAFPHERLGSILLRFLNRLKQTGRAANTIAAYRTDLTLFLDFLERNKIHPGLPYPGIRDQWRHFLVQAGRVSDASTRRAEMGVRSFLHFLVVEKLIESSPLLEEKSPRQPRHDLTVISEKDYKFMTCELTRLGSQGDEKSLRDLGLIYLLGECGLKASEVSALRWSDVLLLTHFEHTPCHASNAQSDGENITTGGSVRIPGQHERVVSFCPLVQEALSNLKRLREKLHLGVAPHDQLFFGYLNMSRRTRTDSLHRHGIKFIVYEVCEALLHKPYNSESLRNRAISRWLSQGISVQKVADLAGYSSLQSLERFISSASTTHSKKALKQEHVLKDGISQKNT